MSKIVHSHSFVCCLDTFVFHFAVGDFPGHRGYFLAPWGLYSLQPNPTLFNEAFNYLCWNKNRNSTYMGSKHSTQHVRSLDGKNYFVESLAIRKMDFLENQWVKILAEFQWGRSSVDFSVGWNFETDILLRKWITEQRWHNQKWWRNWPLETCLQLRS